MTPARAAEGADNDEARAGWSLAAVGLAVRLAVVLWAAPRFPPVEDGHFYDVVAGRIAAGLGYTWLWPDGAVTYAAHYPVGYPALVGLGYALFGPHPVVAMVENALLGAVAVRAVHGLVWTTGSRRAATASAVLAALHPGLVLYVPALMTEGAAAALVVVAAWLAVRGDVTSRRASFVRVVGSGVALGAATLVRPQVLLFAPLFGLLAGSAWKARAWAAVVTTGVALAVCSPWTLRNCARMHSCALVSVNAGWNLYIGAARGATGTFAPIEALGVPPECRTVWDEAEKDACFGRAGRAAISGDPLRWISLVPRKLALTFDYAGAAGWYLHASDPVAFPDRAKVVLGTVETLYERLVVLASLIAIGCSAGPRARPRRGVSLVSGLLLFTRSAWVAHLGLVAAVALLGRDVLRRPPAFVAAAVVLGTALVHAVFFGAGRYSLVCFPALSALAGTVLTLGSRARDN
ncbi:MAG TPA: glycosyltransferase family 39 protein [Polyangiaceae bacterium]|nr:glycosyltransferase family 39 protein [Polyangiaceae bacterium]